MDSTKKTELAESAALSAIKAAGQQDRAAQTRLKNALLELISSKKFEQISVTELCRKAGTSRVTFYTYYDDKYTLLDDYFKDMLKSASTDFDRMQKENNVADEPIAAYCNLLDSILNLYDSHRSFFTHAEPNEDQVLYFQYYWYVLRHLENLTVRYCHELKPILSVPETSSFLCNGLWSFIQTSHLEHRADAEIRSDTQRILKIVLSSGLFVQ